MLNISERIYEIAKKIGDAPIAVYGTGNGAKSLLSQLSKANINILGLVDVTENVVSEVYGYPVFSIEQLLEKVKYIIISSESFQEIIYDRICWVEERGIKVIKIYPTPFDFIVPNHFRADLNIKEAGQLFKSSIKMVEIEVFSYCNRRCWFCPNSFVDRISENKYMDERLYLSILQQLKDINYSAKISYSRYNEPLADQIILNRLAQAASVLPDSLLHLNTNGDYLNRAYLSELYSAGLRSMNIQVYLGNEEHYDHLKTEERMASIINKLVLSEVPIKNIPGEWIESKLIYKDMDIHIYGRNFDKNGCNRGGAVEIRNDYLRNSPCLSPFSYMYIDYNGKVMPCCNLRSDLKEHHQAIVWDLSVENDIFKAYASKNLVTWRRNLIDYEEKNGFCKSCAFGLFECNENYQKIINKLSGLLKTLDSKGNF